MDQIVERPKKATPPRPLEAVLAVGPQARAGRRLWRWLLALVVLAGCVAGGYAWWSTGQGPAQIAFSTVPAERGSFTVEITATGTLQPLTQVDVSSELSGVVRAVPVQENQSVRQGDVLAELDTTRLSAQVERAAASVQAAEAKVKETQTTLRETEQALARAQSLRERGMIAEQALETATAARDRADSAVATAQANLGIAQADLKLQQADLAKSVIYAPIDGIVLTRDVDPGQTVASSFSAPVLFVIAEDLRTMVVEAAIDEADIGAVEKGQKATFTVDAFPGRRFDATISDIAFASATTEGVVTYEAKLTVDNADLLLRPGMTATVAIVTRDAEDVLMVPSAAFRFRPPVADTGTGGLQSLFTGRRPMGRMFERRAPTVGADGSRTLYVLRDGQPVAVSVRTGASDGEHAEIVSGLSQGDQVIIGTRTAGARTAG